MGISKNKIILIIFLFCFIIINLYLTTSIIHANSINNNIIRLHIVANSNSIDDQLIKLKISQLVENYISDLNFENKTSSEIIEELKNNSENIIAKVNDKLLEENANYKASINIGKIYYNEEKDNAVYHMDKGYYNSLKIILGDGNGKNFWNFIAPNKENLKKLKQYETILPNINKMYENDYNSTTYKSKILELFNGNKNL